MKSIFFHLMPYRDLPDDFEERYESVWVTPPNAELCDPVKVAQYYKWNLDELELADRLGFDGIGVNEHHQNAYGFMASPNLMAAAVARRTPNNSAILVLGNTLALYQPALRVAEEFAMLDCMTDGRLAAGFPVGTSMDVNRCYGVTPTETRPRFYEAHDLIMKAWTQPGPFPYNGRFNKLRYVNPWPQPLQKPHPPVWLAGGGSVETYEMAVNHDYTYSFLSFFGYQFAKKVMDGFWETADRLGADRNPYRAGFAQQICVAETDAQAEEQYLEHVTYFFKKCLHIPPYYFETPGYRTRRSTEFALKTNQPGDIAAALTAEKDWKALVDKGFIIAGSPDTVAERLIEACRGCVSATSSRCCRSARCPTSSPSRTSPCSPRRSCRGSAVCGPTRAGSTGGGRRAPARMPRSRRAGGGASERDDHTDRVLRRAPRRPLQDPRPVGRRRSTRSSSCTAPAACSGTPSSTPSPPATASSRPSIRAPATRRGSSTSRTCGTSSCTTTSCSTRSASPGRPLVGHSFGGMVAAEIAANNPAAVSTSSC